jgi:hypothetical protein
MACPYTPNRPACCKWQLAPLPLLEHKDRFANNAQARVSAKSLGGKFFRTFLLEPFASVRYRKREKIYSKHKVLADQIRE